MSEIESRCETSRLLLEPLRAYHASLLFEALGNLLVYQHVNEEPPESVDELAAHFSRMSQGPPLQRMHERWLNFAIQLKADAHWIGRIQATVHSTWAEVGFLFGPSDWGHGYASESLAWLHQHLRSQQGVGEFWAAVTPANERSIRLLLRAGYRQASLCEGRILGSIEPGDKVFRFGEDNPSATPSRTEISDEFSDRI